MSYPSVIYWPPSIIDESIIAKTQDVDEDANVVLLGNVPDAPGLFKYDSIIRSINISSGDDLSGVTFVISGIGVAVDANGNPTSLLGPITEEVTGPNDDKSSTENIYTQINEIMVTGAAATDVTITYGNFGITQYVTPCYNRKIAQIAVSGQAISDSDIGAVSYSVYKSFNKPETPNIKTGTLDPFGLKPINGTPTQIAFVPAFEVIAETITTEEAIIDGPAALVWATITEGTTGSFIFTVLQQGIS